MSREPFSSNLLSKRPDASNVERQAPGTNIQAPEKRQNAQAPTSRPLASL